MLASASATFAQDAIKQVLGAKTYDEALTVINAQGASMSNEDKAKAYNKVVDLALAKFDAERNVQLTNQVSKKNDPVDTEGMNKAIVEALKAGVECEKYDNMPNEKGKVKPKFHKANCDRLYGVRVQLINMGQDAFNAKNYAAALEQFGLYTTTKSEALFADKAAEPDQYLGQIAYFAALAAYNAQDYALASKYSDVAMQDKDQASDALDIKVLSMKAQLKTKEDSLKYLEEIKDLYAKDSKNERFFGLLCEYYQAVNDAAAKTALISKQVAENPGSKMAWALKGEEEMGQKQWGAAIEDFKKSIEIDPEFIQVTFNIGVCYNSKARDFKDEKANKITGQLSPADDTAFKADLNEAAKYLELVKAKDPDRNIANWAYPLYQTYFMLGDEAKAKEMEALLQQ